MNGIKKLHNDQDEFIKKTLQEDKTISQPMFDSISDNLEHSKIKVKKYSYKQQKIIRILLLLLAISLAVLMIRSSCKILINLKSRTPLCRVPAISPGPLNLRSISEISNPLLLLVIICTVNGGILCRSCLKARMLCLLNLIPPSWPLNFYAVTRAIFHLPNISNVWNN